MVILMKVGYRNLIPFGVVLSHDGCDLSIRNVILSAGKKGFVPTLLRQRWRERLSENSSRTSGHSRTHFSSPSYRACHEDLTHRVMKRCAVHMDLRKGSGESPTGSLLPWAGHSSSKSREPQGSLPTGCLLVTI